MSKNQLIKEGDLVELVGLRHHYFIIRLEKNGQTQTHRGIIYHNDLIAKEWGSQVNSHLGNPFYLFCPSIHNLILDTKRNTQILYPKDIGLILVTMGIGPGSRVIEAGSGSGGFTQALAFFVGQKGHIFSYEMRTEALNLAKKNISKLGFDDRVDFFLKDIQGGFQQENVDAVFLDLPNPFDYLSQVKSALKPGGSFGSILPTVNQVIILINALRRHHFAFIEVCETLLRYYKTEENRLRPTDRMVAHTGYLIFAKSIIHNQTKQEKE